MITRADEIRNLESQILELSTRRHRLLQEERDDASRDWIRVNNVTADQVMRSDEGRMPWFGHVATFHEWVMGLPYSEQKPYAEWNTMIFRFTNAGFVETPGLCEHLKNWEGRK